MNTPCIELDKETILLQLMPLSLIDHPAEFVRHPPRSPSKSRLRNSDPSLRWLVRQIDDNEVVRVFRGPGPGDEVVVGLIIRPSRPLAKLPLTALEIVSTQDAKERDIKLQKSSIDKLFWTAPQEHRKPDAPTVELSVMEQHRSLQGGNRDGRRPRL